MTKVTENFTLAELTASPAAKRLGLKNNPSPAEIENLRHVCLNILERVREHYNRPLKINSGYRSPKVNAAVKGSVTSQHRYGEAVDFEIPGIPNKEIADWIADNLEFDQVILEFYNPKDGPSSGWVHVSLKRVGKNRRQRLIAQKSSRGTVYKQVADFNPATKASSSILRAPTLVAAPKLAALANFQKKLGEIPDNMFGRRTLRAGAKLFGLTNVQAAHFFGQCAHETQNFTKFVENLNYSAQGLLSEFPAHFTKESAKNYARNPEAIANKIYSNKNGNIYDGDGWKFIGRGACHLSGRSNYQKFADSIDRQDILSNPDIVANELAFESAKFFFDSNKLWSICDAGINDIAITALTKSINGGTKGLVERKELTRKMYSMLKEL